ncbi:26S proteasome non-ATPase regulatory subunit 5 isoform X2 [Oratosquilla oratoria]|uniref:26S proteasome non-ATPase regulatory subunit 5 isoform X2 n=1 Tax=Oratosquilla oratoria TaxID=337810 RepID=UPI003F76DE2C
MEEVIRVLGELSLSNEPTKHLQELKTALITAKSSRQPLSPGNLDLHSLFDSVNTDNGEQIDLAVDILSEFLPLYEPQAVLERFSWYLLRGLIHPNTKVRELIIKQIDNCVENEGGLTAFLANQSYVIAVISALGDESLSVSKYAVSTLLQVAHIPAGLHTIFTNETISSLQQSMAKSDSARFNVYEAIIKISVISPEALQVVAKTGLLEKLINEVTRGDILTQLNALELLIPLVLTEHGLALLHESGVVSKLQYLLSLAHSDPMASLLVPGLIKFFGNLGYSMPNHLAKEYNSVMHVIFNLATGKLDMGEPSFQVLAIDTLAHIATTAEGKIVLGKFQNEMDQVLHHMGERIQTAPTDLRVRMLEAMAELFSVEAEWQTTDVITITEKWWKELVGNNMSKIMNIARQPFPELRCTSLAIINVVAQLPWGQKMIKVEPGMVEYLLDRSTEPDKAGKEAKWDIVTTLVHSPTSHSIFTDTDMSRFEKYFTQGPFYVHTETQVAFEGDT